MDSVAKELEEAEIRIEILKRQLANAAGNENNLTYRPNRGDTVQKYREMETVL